VTAMARQPQADVQRLGDALRKTKQPAAEDIQAMPPFEAGQLITAADLNRLVEAMKALDRRLVRLERR
jgi:hypothetical protein